MVPEGVGEVLFWPQARHPVCLVSLTCPFPSSASITPPHPPHLPHRPHLQQVVRNSAVCGLGCAQQQMVPEGSTVLQVTSQKRWLPCWTAIPHLLPLTCFPSPASPHLLPLTCSRSSGTGQSAGLGVPCSRWSQRAWERCSSGLTLTTLCASSLSPASPHPPHLQHVIWDSAVGRLGRALQQMVPEGVGEVLFWPHTHHPMCLISLPCLTSSPSPAARHLGQRSRQAWARPAADGPRERGRGALA
ncbi:unnamed protein product [Closterium sp. NIES-54]